ncbi:YceI-like domain protein [Bacteriovorax sp. BSW11_IV]|uniref:YceI family protein n=1 Tax=Bacteriovorax sp. BSW11_IV TaxID=1353529 RepID=UPI000389F2BC|nr:YceI family protein [Bacteriovorax sp. BSW11_IV]EQC44544.1 YceI-like domain protein [Bacteriovorax sp. BSW11_IV]
MKKFITVLALLSLNAFSADVDLAQSSFNWKGTKVTGEHVGGLKLKSASLEVDKDLIKSGEFVIDMNTLSVTDLQGEWADKFLGHIKNEDFFDVGKFPTSKLKITSATKDVVKGDLTIKGKTQPVSIKFKKEGKAYVGKLVFDRTKFDMVYGSGDFFKNLGDKMIHNDVAVDFKVVVK